jgi:hypothetical protein
MEAKYDGDVGVLIEGMLHRSENGSWVITDEATTHEIENVLKSCAGEYVRVVCVKIKYLTPE